MRLFRVGVATADIDRGRRFYEQVLGIAADDTVPSRLYFHCGETILALIDRSGPDRGSFVPNSEHLYFAVDDVEATKSRAAAAGATISSELETRPWGERSFYCSDPDGNRLCFVESTTAFFGRGAPWQ